MSERGRVWVLVVIALAQLMVVLDTTVVTIALPAAQADLHISAANRQLVVTAYTLAFGGLLLLGGRLSDLIGRKRMFLIGLASFAVASAIGGAAKNLDTLLGARALQGASAAALAPSALSLLTTTFTDPHERSKAFGIYSAIGAGGSAIGLILGGLLTDYLDWRWCLYINLPIAAVAVLGASIFLRNDHGSAGVRLDLPGVLLGCGGLLALVGGFTQAESRGWRDGHVLALLIAGLVLLGVFALVQRNVRNPLLPMRIIADRNRAGALISIMMATSGMFSTFLFLSYYLQGSLHYSPIMTGLAFLPVTAAIAVSATQITSRLLTKVPSRVVLMPAFVFAAGGELWFTQLPPSGGYGLHILPGLILLGLGLGGVIMTSMSTATADAPQKDAGVTSAAANTAQQVGGSLGTALLNTIAASATASYLSTHSHNLASATSYGYTTAFWVSVGIFLLAAVIGGALIHSNLRGSDS